MTRTVDTLVIGSGVAGLFAALRATKYGSVMLVSKSSLAESNTRYAQGGIAAVLFPDDSVEAHTKDTLAAGAGLCNEIAVGVLCREGPERVRELIGIGVEFDRSANELARGLEAAHSAARVLHAGGDATGKEVQRGLEAAVRKSNVIIEEHTYLTELIASKTSVSGARFLRNNGADFDVQAQAVVLATGGAGQAFAHTTNPDVATGDGVAAAFRAGAVIADAEMYQFHPTLLAGPGAFLISEAVRGEGAVLRNINGDRFMVNRHPSAELAPRDVVARSIAEEMATQDGAPVMLDATALGAEFLARRFPTIDSHCRNAGLDWAKEPIPVTPAAHFWMGGVATDIWGQTSLSGLYAIGEVACSGVHGANRLASNSLLEGLVFAERAIRHISSNNSTVVTDVASSETVNDHPAIPVSFDTTPTTAGYVPSVTEVKQLAWDNLGLVRNEHGLRIASKQLGMWASDLPRSLCAKDWERANLITVAQLIATSASMRRESRGAHFRSDIPQRDNNHAPTHTLLRRQS